MKGRYKENERKGEKKKGERKKNIKKGKKFFSKIVVISYHFFPGFLLVVFHYSSMDNKDDISKKIFFFGLFFIF